MSFRNCSTCGRRGDANQNTFVRSVMRSPSSRFPFSELLPLYAAVCGIRLRRIREGAKEGFGVILKIIPFLVTMWLQSTCSRCRWNRYAHASARADPQPVHSQPDLVHHRLGCARSARRDPGVIYGCRASPGPDNIVSLMAATVMEHGNDVLVAAVYSVLWHKQRDTLSGGIIGGCNRCSASVTSCRAVL